MYDGLAKFITAPPQTTHTYICIVHTYNMYVCMYVWFFYSKKISTRCPKSCPDYLFIYILLMSRTESFNWRNDEYNPFSNKYYGNTVKCFSVLRNVVNFYAIITVSKIIRMYESERFQSIRHFGHKNTSNEFIEMSNLCTYKIISLYIINST